ncbi:anaerobic ribonucleoside-triphosphate reductase activating protein [Clostridium oceanicum]|uniref:Anaerobic ribonucleoside-triphosphate reductase-activating protein n=1 Tax=Clostridium oceanicum TaxID=1543 RepID=A0ABP3UWU8_9CLOT
MNRHSYLQVAGFLDNSLVNGKGLRSVLFVSGCYHNCKNCQNKEMQSIYYGDKVNVDDVLNRIKNNLPLIKGVTFSGGEPFEQAENLALLGGKLKKLNLDLWCYSGYTFEYIKDNMHNKKGWKDLIQSIDVLIDGKYEEKNNIKGLKYRGSSNQRIIDVKETLEKGKVVCLKYF